MIIRNKNRRMRAFVRNVGQDDRGVALLEFALVLPVLLILTLGTLELGYQAYMRSIANGVLERAARLAAVGNIQGDQIDMFIKAQMVPILAGQDPETSVAIVKQNYRNFSNVGGGEKITGDTAPVGSYNSTDCYEDRNGDGVFNTTNGGASGIGGADDIVFYDVTVTTPRLIPVVSFLIKGIFTNADAQGWAENTVVNAKTIIRNQPFAEQAVAVIRCS